LRNKEEYVARDSLRLLPYYFIQRFFCVWLPVNYMPLYQNKICLFLCDLLYIYIYISKFIAIYLNMDKKCRAKTNSIIEKREYKTVSGLLR
jgi:hypothetical protein